MAIIDEYAEATVVARASPIIEAASISSRIRGSAYGSQPGNEFSIGWRIIIRCSPAPHDGCPRKP